LAPKLCALSQPPSAAASAYGGENSTMELESDMMYFYVDYSTDLDYRLLRCYFDISLTNKFPDNMTSTYSYYQEHPKALRDSVMRAWDSITILR
jgi:hypothetical protein